MAFTITGTATDLDLDVDNLPRLTCTALTSWTVEGGTARVMDARGVFDAQGAVVKDDEGAWVIGAPESTPMLLRSSPSAFPPIRFDAPADGATLDLAGLLATLPVTVPSPSHPFVKGDKGDTGERGPKGDTGDVGPRGPKGDKGDPGTTSIAQDGTTQRIYWTGA